MMVGMIPHLRGSSRNVAELSDIRGWWLTNWRDLRARLELCIVGADREQLHHFLIWVFCRCSDSSNHTGKRFVRSKIIIITTVNFANPSNHFLKSKAL